MKINEIYFNLEGPKKKRNTSSLKFDWIIFGIIAFIIVLLNVIAWLSPCFCDWHIKYVFNLWVNTYGRFTSLFGISIGEILLCIGVALLIIWLIALIVSLIARRFRFLKHYSKTIAWILLIVCFIMTENCSILYHGTTFETKYLKNADKEYTLEDLTWLRDYIVEQCNSLAEQMERDEHQDLVYAGNINADSIVCMQKLGETYPELSGYYVNPKYFSFSKFFSQQYIMGYYFPFSMEANYNKLMYISNFPSTACHELSHTKGFMQEYDANFISFLACTESDNLFFQYCGYLSILNYVDNDYFKAIGKDKDVYFSHVNKSDLVNHDNIFLTKASWDEVEETAVIDTQTVKEVSDNLMETSLVLNGVSEGMISYSKVVGLLLRYYDE